DKQAYREYLSKEAPDKSLLKTRLLCDGAYFDLALDALTNNAVHIAPTQKNNAELSYRLARIYHNWNKITKAISYYELTVKNYSELKYYYAANSALQLGLIYEKQKDLKKAEYYYKKCLTIKTEEYVNSIRQKAKAGLRRIFDK
ncbi:MAG: tetratricopeptide repeat protein, partial [Bacteroidales bacterium]|nr:tetratricopeptide repeat protein [Bacteroidales bacterium]